MTLVYGPYTIYGTVKEIREFILSMDPVTVNSSMNTSIDGILKQFEIKDVDEKDEKNSN